MPDYDRLRSLIAKRLKECDDTESSVTDVAQKSNRDSAKKKSIVRISAPTLYSALEKASDALKCAVPDISYQILIETNDEPSSNKIVVIRAQRKNQDVAPPVDTQTENSQSSETDTNSAIGVQSNNAIDENVNEDNKALSHPPYSIKKQAGKIMVRVDNTHADFARLTALALSDVVEKRTGQRVDTTALQECIDNADGAYHAVGYFPHDYNQDATHKIFYGQNNLSARIVFTPPKKNGNDYSAYRLAEILKNEGISYGVNKALLTEIEEYPRYNHRYLVAKGDLAVDGKDAQIVYSEECRVALASVEEQNSFKLEERVNYKERNSIVNVIKGTVLADLVPAAKGQDGKNIFGDVIRAKDGQSKELRVGRNVELSGDARQAIATIDGQFREVDGLLVVDPLHEVHGDVGIKSGNVLFLGDVIVHGNVDDGFSVRASGKIEIYGFVGAAQLDSEMGIRIRKGIAGKGRAFINSGGDCTAQYIELATVHAGGSVFAGESIVQSRILAGDQVRCGGKRASIVGAEVISGTRVFAKMIGSAVGVETKISVGYDPFRLMRLDALGTRRDALKQQINHLKHMQRKSDLLFEEDGVAYKLSKVEQIQAEIAIAKSELDILLDDITTLEEEITATQMHGEICATGTMHPQVVVSINGIVKKLERDFNMICFKVVDKKIVSQKAEKPK